MSVSPMLSGNAYLCRPPMMPIRLFSILLVASAILLLSFRAPVWPVQERSGSSENWSLTMLELPFEESQGTEENNNGTQQSPLEELHDMHCSGSREQFLFWQQDEVSTNGLHPLLWMRIPLMSCFQPPEQG